MIFKNLKDYNLEKVLSPLTEKIWNDAAIELKCKSYIDIYKAFLLVTHKEKVENFCLMKNTEIQKKFLNHIKSLAGFIACEFDTDERTRATYFRVILKIINYIHSTHMHEQNCAFDKNLSSKIFINECIETYQKGYVNSKQKNYFEGWVAYSSDHKKLNLNFSKVYEYYGEEFFNKFLKGVSSLLSNYIYTTAQRILISINKLTSYILITCKNIKELRKNTSSEYVHTFFTTLYQLQLIDIKLKNQDLFLFHRAWGMQVFVYMNLVDLNVFPKPFIDIVIPNFRSVERNQKNIKIKGSNEVVHSKLITQIPISITDDEAVERILEKIKYDIDFIKNCAKLEIKKIKERLNNFYLKASKGEIKKRSDSNSNFNPIRVGEGNIENSCATYLAAPFKNEEVANFANFLGFRSKKPLNNIIFYCSNDTLYPFMILLINEHPLITESWLINFKIYKNNKKVGYQEINNEWYITSLKKRRGIKLAEQPIKTTLISKNLFNDILEITKINRDYLKNINSLDYEYLFITSWSPFIEPKKIETIYHPNSLKNNENLKNIFYNNIFSEKYIMKYGKEELDELVNNFTLTKFRASCAIKVYLETKSIYEMSKALGHKEYQQKLMKSYLPEPIWKFFTTRWIRIFQNALVYEAMKDSDYLFQAVDFKKEELNEFIENHAFKELPNQINTYKSKHSDNQIDNEKIGIFPISVALLQWFIGIKEFVLAHGLDALNEVAEHWWQSAMLVVTQIELTLDPTSSHSVTIEDKVLKMYEKAKDHPLSPNFIKDVLT